MRLDAYGRPRESRRAAATAMDGDGVDDADTIETNPQRRGARVPREGKKGRGEKNKPRPPILSKA
eukprot:6331105-Lingulodinium_polyedra.AAC.1